MFLSVQCFSDFSCSYEYQIAGTFAALLSHVIAARLRLPAMIAAYARPSSGKVIASANSVLPSMGASGAIYASVVVAAMAFPHLTVTFVFLPWIPMSIATGVGAALTLDVVGLIRGWQ